MFKLPELPYSYDALEPYIDAKTMEIHVHKHHQAYVDNLNKALEQYPLWQDKDLSYLLSNLDKIPQDIQIAVKNNGGGHYNHSLFWQMMSLKSAKLKGLLLQDIIKQFQSFDQFCQQFELAAKTCFGSGWAFFALNKQGNLEIFSAANQDTTLLQGAQTILALDVWEHAYYLHYQNRRFDYIKAWWNVVNWDFVGQRYMQLLGK